MIKLPPYQWFGQHKSLLYDPTRVTQVEAERLYEEGHKQLVNRRFTQVARWEAVLKALDYWLAARKNRDNPEGWKEWNLENQRLVEATIEAIEGE